MNNRQQFFVHVDLGDGKPVVAGFHEINLAQNVGTFFYGRSYCENPNAFALDPINLPLIYEKRFHFPITRFNPTGIPGVLIDSGPDEWGKRILNRFADEKPVSPADYLVMGSGYGVGALSFSDSPEPNEGKLLKQSDEIDKIYQSILDFDDDISYELPIEHFLMPSSGIGGARPKAHMFHNGKHTIAKFNRRDDPFDNALAEFCMMRLARDIGIDCAHVNVIETSQGNAILVERFDIADTKQSSTRHHLISANALLNVADLSDLNSASYDRIAATGKQISKSIETAKDVFTRMLFNIAIGNTDDHTRNHAFIKYVDKSDYVLSPAYDLVPLPFRIGSHAINIGPFGQMPTLENIKTSGRLMGLSDSDQAECAFKIDVGLENLEDKLLSFSMKIEDIDYLQPCFSHRHVISTIAS